MKQKLLLVAAVFFGLLAFILTYKQIQNERDKALGRAEWVSVVKFTQQVPAGEEISISDIIEEKVQMFKTAKKDKVKWFNKDSVLKRGKLLVTKLPGDFLNWSELSTATFRSKRELSTVIPRGYRAVSISVDSVGSVTNMIRPGNKVDLIGTFRFPGNTGDKSYDTLTLTVLQNVEILATGGVYDSAMSSRQRNYSTVTLSLTPKESEMVIFASQKGRLQLILRNPLESATTDNVSQ